MAHIFISRAVDPDIWSDLSEHCITGQSLIEISPLEFSLPDCDWVFFYSSNGVRHFFKQAPAQFIPYKWACLGKGTAATLGEYVLDIDYVGNGVPSDVSDELVSVIQADESICFLRAENSQDSVFTLLEHKKKYSLPVYSNNTLVPDSCGPYDVLVFTSPMNAEAYLKACKVSDEKIIAIGQTTARYLRAHYDGDILVPVHPTEAAIKDLVSSIL